MAEEAQCSHLTGPADCTPELEKAATVVVERGRDRATETDCLPSIVRQEESCTTTKLAMTMADTQTV